MTEVVPTVIATYGRAAIVRVPDDCDRIAVTRGRRSDLCVGDEVDVAVIGRDQAVIESVRERRTLLARSDAARTKLLAANVDRAAIVISAEPRFDEELLLRIMIAAEAAGIDAFVIANKRDLAAEHATIASRLAAMRSAGYVVLEISVKADPEGTRDALEPLLAGHSTVVLGQSGMGKSSLMNLLVPGAEQATRDISRALRAGRHTTTSSRLFDIGIGGRRARLIDTPGFQSFGLAHLSESEKTHGMRDFAGHLGKCRFHSCTHRTEPQCAIRAASEDGRVDAIRYRLFTGLVGRN